MEKLTEQNLLLYAAKHYYNPRFSDIEEFNEDLKRFKYIKRLVNRYLETGKLSERLILNHIIILFNVFDIEPALNMLEIKLDEKQWSVVKPFLIFLNYIKNDQLIGIDMDKKVVEALRKI
jgi:hypothetical protein|tara:strand:- start:883 stop:1242 length:360 start_codon:yes stop_codon:yes gene_type:complete